MSKASQIRQKAQEYLGKGQIDKAILEYRRLISIESKNPNLYNELGDIYLRASDKAQAVQNFEKAATIYEKVALYNNAVAVCKKILRVEPEKAGTIFRVAELRAKQKLEGDAVTFFSQYVEYVLANPQDLLRRSQKDVERMLELMPSSEPIMAKAVEIYEQLGMRLRTAELCSKLSLIAQEKGDFKKQTLYSRKVEELRSGLTPEETEEMGSNASGDGEAPVADANAEEEATETTEPPRETASLEDPAEVPPAASGTSSPGAEPPSHEIEEEPLAVGSAEPDLDPSVREAVEETEMVAAMNREQDMPIHAAIPEARAQGMQKEEVSSVRGAAQPGTPPERSASQSAPPSVAHESRPRSGTGHSGGLVEEITSDVEKDDLRSHFDLGMAYLEMGLFTEAIKDFQIASRCEELQLSSMEMIGYCFLKNNQPRLAVKQLTRALDNAKVSGINSLGIHYNLGLAHEMLGELEAAREHFEEVYIGDLTFRDVSQKMKKLSATS